MWAQLTRRTLLSLTLGVLLFLRPTVALANCTANCTVLLQQLKKQITILKEPVNLLKPYMKALGLTEDLCEDKRDLKSVEVVTFPNTDDLQALSRLDFLHTVRGKQEQMKRKFEFAPLFINLRTEGKLINLTLSFIRGFSNNLHCMSQKLSNHFRPTEPTQEVPRTPTAPTPKYELKWHLCLLLRDYHIFMKSVDQVFESKWKDNHCRSRRRRGRPNPWKKTRRTRGSRRGKKSISRGLSPQKPLGAPVDGGTADAL